MIGKLNVSEPTWDEKVVVAVEEIREEFGQDYRAILEFGLYGATQDWPEAQLVAGYKCLQERPDEGAVWLSVARLHGELREFEQAEAILREIKKHGGLGLFAEVFCEDVDVHYAYLLAAKGRIDEAHGALLTLEARHGEHPLYRYLLASLLHDLSFFEEAVGQYDRALALVQAIEPDMFDAIEVEAARDYIAGRKAEAAAGKEFTGVRPMNLEELAGADSESGEREQDG